MTTVQHRYESFGGIIANNDPPFLAYVDRQFMREQGYTDSVKWQGPETIDRLSAPVEVHLACTNRCQAGCPHCYVSAQSNDPDELDTNAFKAALDKLAEIGVFHVALGGGEALERDDLFELAAHARAIGLVPNLTSNGLLINEAIAKKMTVFGQVNLSLDGVGDAARAFRPLLDFDRIDRAFDQLLAAGVRCGINCTLGRDNYPHLSELFQYAADKGLAEIELLRFKPAGRAISHWQAQKMTPTQNREFFPHIQALAELAPFPVKIDCSFVPMLCACDPPMELLQQFGVCGCEAGNFLLGADSAGRVAGCSFLPMTDLRIADLADAWDTHPRLEALRSAPERLGEPCTSCPYLQLCRGGCRAVSLVAHGNPDCPDPDCPRVATAL